MTAVPDIDTDTATGAADDTALAAVPEIAIDAATAAIEEAVLVALPVASTDTAIVVLADLSSEGIDASPSIVSELLIGALD